MDSRQIIATITRHGSSSSATSHQASIKTQLEHVDPFHPTAKPPPSNHIGNPDTLTKPDPGQVYGLSPDACAYLKELVR
ncbi:Hypothetical protein NTJ_03038 [Nesidiocoris tenuis]|uniref:Uncharacterized protein n=1 Tax=Nesidiocoris tenuis TaxID=355587 RepID=A0ABN7AFT6_9HEMI|nr:Hypothetical protein NTJ_03038 [Nesidiocoris tenuis]